MKALRKILERPGQKLRLFAAAALLLVTAGCLEEDLIEMITDPEPEQGEYKVNNTARVELTEQSPSAIINLNVECVGNHLPPGCSANQPAWELGKGSLNSAYFSYTIADWGSPHTTATITINWNDFATVAPTSLGSPTERTISFIPYSVPEGLRVTGNTTTDVYIRSPSPPGGTRLVEPANTPHLTPIPTGLMKQFVGYSVGVAYKGVANDLVVTLEGDHPEKFSYTLLGTFPVGGNFEGGGGNSLTGTAVFLGAIDSQTYTAKLKFAPVNGGNTVYITLSGRQQ